MTWYTIYLSGHDNIAAEDVSVSVSFFLSVYVSLSLCLSICLSLSLYSSSSTGSQEVKKNIDRKQAFIMMLWLVTYYDFFLSKVIQLHAVILGPTD